MRWALLFVGLVGCEEAVQNEEAQSPAEEMAQRDAMYDVVLGYDRTVTALAPLGTWRKSRTRVVEWCPRGSFVPFRTDGHWVKENDHLRWQANASDWRDTTTHSGHWVLIESRDEWCWVPGVIHDDAPVVWRAGHGFIGWAPRGGRLVERSFTYVREKRLGDARIEPLAGDLASAAHAQTSFVSPPRELPAVEDKDKLAKSAPIKTDAPMHLDAPKVTPPAPAPSSTVTSAEPQLQEATSTEGDAPKEETPEPPPAPKKDALPQLEAPY